MTEEQRQRRRESGMLVIGVVIGGLFGIMGGLWSAYFVEWYKSISPVPNPDWTPVVIGSTVILVIITVCLVIWAKKQLEE
jgi:polyferredoxin